MGSRLPLLRCLTAKYLNFVVQTGIMEFIRFDGEPFESFKQRIFIGLREVLTIEDARSIIEDLPDDDRTDITHVNFREL